MDGFENTLYRPLVIECGTEGIPTLISRLRTYFICWPDHCAPNWSIVLWTIGSAAFFVADTAADLAVAGEYFASGDYYWASLLTAFVFLPSLISLLFFVSYRQVYWYQAYPVGVIYWSWRTLHSYFRIPSAKKINSSTDAVNFLLALRTFQDCNRERSDVGELDIYFGSLPQLILQSYIAATVAHDTGVNEITVASWLSLALSSLNLLRYEPSSHESRTGIIVDVETVLEPAFYDYLAENFFDLMAIVPRAVAIGCFLTVKPFIGTGVFFPLHLLVTYIWCWLSAPRHVPGFDSKERDFRGQRRDRSSYLDHFQAAIATLLFAPTHRVWPKDFGSWRDRFTAVLTRQFVVVTTFQISETVMLLGIWLLLAPGEVRALPTVIAVMSWTAARNVCHVLYYAFLLFPVYTHEWEQCCRRRGLIAKAELIRMSELLGGYFCPQIRPRLELVVRFFQRKKQLDKTDQDELLETLEWLQSNTCDAANHSTNRLARHRLLAMGHCERNLLQKIKLSATSTLEGFLSKNEISRETEAQWAWLLEDCTVLISYWREVLLACLTHRKLPSTSGEVERDVKVSAYPKMYSELIARNNLIYKRARGLPLLSVRRLPKPPPLMLPLGDNAILLDMTSGTNSNPNRFDEERESFGGNLDFQFVT